MKAYIGIDPGQSGGIALVQEGTPACAWKMPETERDVFDLIASLKRWDDAPTMAVIEAVHSMPRQGVASSFKFGRNYGGLRMALIGAGIPFREVTPGKWQKDMGCLSKGDKNVTKAKAQQLFPHIKITHALADALLIAQWGHATLK